MEVLIRSGGLLVPVSLEVRENGNSRFIFPKEEGLVRTKRKAIDWINTELRALGVDVRLVKARRG